MTRSATKPTAVLAVLALAVGASIVEAADPIPVGSEIVVTDSLVSQVYTPRVASDPAGNFLVVWEEHDEGKVEGRGFYATGNAQGPVFQISAADHYVSQGGFVVDELLAVAADAAGNFVVAFNAYDSDAAYQAACYGSPCIYTRRRDANGLLAPASFIVADPRLNVYQPYYNTYNQTAGPELSIDGFGNFIVTWEGYDEVYHEDHFDVDEGVWGRRLVNSGQVNGGPFRINDVHRGPGAWNDPRSRPTRTPEDPICTRRS